MPAKIAIIYYSMYNHILTLAEGIKEGVKEAGIDADIFQLPETLPAEVLTLMHAPPKSTKYPVLDDPNKLKEYDGFLLGAPTRYGRVPAQVSAFFDMTGGLWASGALVGKYAGIFSSTASQHGGQETTALTTIPFFAHHGIAFVPLGYAEPTGVLNKVDKVVGGSPWGATTIAGSDGSRQVAEEELTVARFQGKSFATLLSTVVRGRELLSATKDSTTSSSAESKVEKTEVKEEKKTEGPVKKEKKGGFLSKLPCCGSAENFDS